MKHTDYLSYIYDIDNISLFLFILEIISPVIMLYWKRHRDFARYRIRWIWFKQVSKW